MVSRMLAYAAVVVFAGVVMAADSRPGEEGSAQTVTADERRREIDTFNAKFLEAHLRMDDAAILGMWAEDGVSLLPERSPIVGKPAITKFLTGVTVQLKGWRMEKMELDFQGIEVSEDWASEWRWSIRWCGRRMTGRCLMGAERCCWCYTGKPTEIGK
jgi:hypothetical protein